MSTPVNDSFRPDIEGLRAIAVLLVIAAHSRLPGFAGGFIGVDIFFVISGFLITRLLYAEWADNGRIDIMGFYARRMRRLLPAFGLMLGFVLFAVWLVYAPTEQPQFLASASAATLYFSNIHYALEATNYLGPVAKLDPLLHTWSLGVEEQFYLAWPILLLLAGVLTRHNRGRLNPFALLLGGLMLVSFLATLYLTLTHQPLAFFLPVTRAWEFGCGAMVALFGGRLLTHSSRFGRLLARRGMARLASVLALALILVPANRLSEQSAFPGWLALLPVAGTSLLILLLPASGPTPVGRLLTLPPLQWLGKLSYGWYLWHWPLLVVGRELLPTSGLPTDLALVVAGLAVAQLSYSLVEHPVRIAGMFRRRLPSFAMAAVIATVGLVLIHRTESAATREVASNRFGPFMAARQDLPLLYAYNCDPLFYGTHLLECVGGSSNGRKTAVLLGDSHAGQWFTAFHQIMERQGWRLIVMTKSACPIVDEDFFYPRLGRIYFECNIWRQQATRRIQQLQPDLVIASNSENYAFSDQQWREGVRRAMTPLAQASGHLVILRDTPNPGFSAPDCLARREWSPTLSLRPCSFTLGNSPSAQVLAAHQATARAVPRVSVLDMTPQICRETPCQARTDKLIKFRDGNHLTDSFVRSLTPALMEGLTQAGAL